MHHAITRTQARRPVGARPAFCHDIAVAPGQRHIERAARRARGLVSANDLLWRSSQIASEWRVCSLAAPALIFFGERQQRQIGQITDSRALDACFGKLRLIEGRMCPDVIKLRLQALIFQPPQRGWRHCFYGCIPELPLHENTSSFLGHVSPSVAYMSRGCASCFLSQGQLYCLAQSSFVQPAWYLIRNKDMLSKY